MSALGTIWLPLKYMSGAHKISARGRPHTPTNNLQQCTKRLRIQRLDVPGKPANLASDKNASVHLVARRVHWQAEASRLGITIAAKELGYGR